SDFLGCWNLDGSERWAITLENKVGNGSCKITDGKIIVPCFNWGNAFQSMSAFDLQSGSNLWNVIDPAFMFSTGTPVIDEAAGKGYGCSGVLAFQFDLSDGAVGWSKGLPNASGLQNLSMTDSNLFIVDFAFGATVDSNLYSVSKANGTVNWVAQVNVSDMPPAIEGNVLVHSSGDSWGVPQELTGIDLITGTQLWKVAKSLGGWNFMPAISKGVVYASANNATNLTAINVTDGSVISEIALGGTSPAIANDILYTVFEGTLYSYFIPEPFNLLAITVILITLLRKRY
ncbi:PQQ-binding-like beta-propeller repeat protein, partial [bacterium]|nr:PQQ-binding-like beta-propeller repeat protein [bacterium]